MDPPVSPMPCPAGPQATSARRAPRTAVKPHQVPAELLHNELLNSAIARLLPANYNFEIHKTIHQVNLYSVRRLALQLPEGLLQFSLTLSDLIARFAAHPLQTIVMGDVTYGACCVDDFTARALGCQMLVHYGHSCLVPVDQTTIRTLYVFVEIAIDNDHLAQTVRANFPNCLSASSPFSSAPPWPHHLAVELDSQPSPPAGESAQEDGPEEEVIDLAVVGTVQFLSAVQGLKQNLESVPPRSEVDQLLAITSNHQQATLPHSSSARSSSRPRNARFRVTVPQIKPLSPGEILGCTAPRLSPEIRAILYLGDGRFHLESIMIANPTIPAYRYDPYQKRITYEGYDHFKMRKLRSSAISKASQTLDQRGDWGVILGTLGRQGSLSVLNSITSGFSARASSESMAIPILISELSPTKLKKFNLETFVQTSCPRLSIDWGEAFENQAVLNPYEAKLALGQVEPEHGRFSCQDLERSYPMDYYADDSLGDWTPRHHLGRRQKKPTLTATIQRQG